METVTVVFFKTRAHSDSGLIGTPLITALIAAFNSVLLLVVSNLTYIWRPYDTLDTYTGGVFSSIPRAFNWSTVTPEANTSDGFFGASKLAV